MEMRSDDSGMESTGSFDAKYWNSSFNHFVCALLPLAFLLYQSETGQHDTYWPAEHKSSENTCLPNHSMRSLLGYLAHIISWILLPWNCCRQFVYGGREGHCRGRCGPPESRRWPPISCGWAAAASRSRWAALWRPTAAFRRLSAALAAAAVSLSATVVCQLHLCLD